MAKSMNVTIAPSKEIFNLVIVFLSGFFLIALKAKIIKKTGIAKRKPKNNSAKNTSIKNILLEKMMNNCEYVLKYISSTISYKTSSLEV